MTPSSPRATRAAGATVLAAALLASGCRASTPQAGPGDLTVFAAASLTDVFSTLARDYEASHPGAKVTLVFGGSSSLEQQLADGAPGDVFASAAVKNMDDLAATGKAAGPVTFARNRLVVAVPRGNPGKVSAVADLAHARVAVCQPAVPCGAAAQKLFTAVGVHVTPVTQEPDVKAVLTKVRLGEVDAGLVYATDVAAARPAVELVEPPAGARVTTSYPITVVTGAPHAAAASAFVELVRSAHGQQVLAAAGFLPAQGG